MGTNNKKAIRYGDRTFIGWASYYQVWGVRKPSKRTICSHYAKCKAEGMSDDEIITSQKMLWIDNITELDLKSARRAIAEKEANYINRKTNNNE
jgi:hypothetical protein